MAKVNESKLWKAFSEFIRRRDSDENGFGMCFTCGRVIHWKKGDCGHGLGRQHKATKYDEKNNALQCKICNGFEGGKREVFKEQTDKKYGVGTWDLLEIKSRQKTKWSQFEVDILEKHYKQLNEKI